jgi:hypothetical protein
MLFVVFSCLYAIYFLFLTYVLLWCVCLCAVLLVDYVSLIVVSVLFVCFRLDIFLGMCVLLSSVKKK